MYIMGGGISIDARFTTFPPKYSTYSFSTKMKKNFYPLLALHICFISNELKK